jgi:deoxyadenosine kinase
MEHKNYSQTYSHNPTIITISGIIGVGKSTLTKKLSDYYKCSAFLEPVETNEYLDKFYKNMKKYSFPMQIYLLNQRFQQHQQMVWSSDKIVIQDRSIYEDPIFAKMLKEDDLMDELDFKTYTQLFHNMSKFLSRPHLIIYLDVPAEIALERINIRSRNCESGISIEYLQKLKKGYEDWLNNISITIPVLRLSWTEFWETEQVVKCIERKLKNIFTPNYNAELD